MPIYVEFKPMVAQLGEQGTHWGLEEEVDLVRCGRCFQLCVCRAMLVVAYSDPCKPAWPRQLLWGL